MNTNWRLRLLAGLLAGLLTGCAAVAGPVPETGQTAVTEELHVYCFQAGKADAFLLWNSTMAVLIDTGESGFGKVILAKLEELGIAKLDALIITHFDKDHVGGAKKVLESVSVDLVLQSNCPKDASAYHKYVAALEAAGLEAQTLRQSCTLTYGDVTLTVDPPALETYAEDASNNSSLIVSVQHGADRLLFAADAQEARLKELLGSDPGSYAFLKVPYHGRWQSLLPALVEATSPEIAVITASDEEPEDPQTLALLEQYGVTTLLTRRGPVLVKSTGSGVTADYVN